MQFENKLTSFEEYDLCVQDFITSGKCVENNVIKFEKSQ